MLNATQLQFKSLISTSNKILIISSEPLDLDTIASGILTKKYVQSLLSPSQEVKFLFPRRLHSFEYPLNAFVPFFEQEFVGQDTRDDLNSGVYDTLIVLDGSTPSQFYDRANRELLAPVFEASTIIQVDHHDNDDFTNYTHQFKDKNASSTTEILLDQIIPSDFLDENLATVGYCGLVGDTSNFRYNFTSTTLRIASMLVEKNARTTEIINAMFCRKTPEFLRAQAYFITHTDYDSSINAMFFGLSIDSIAKDNLTKEEVGLIKDCYKDIGPSMRDYYVSFLVTEKTPEFVIISGRGSSLKNKISLPDLYIACGFEGGGHFNAASASYSGTVEQAIEILKLNIRNFNQTGSF